MEAVKECLERMWRARSSRSKGLALERSRTTCSIKIKINRSFGGVDFFSRNTLASSSGVPFSPLCDKSAMSISVVVLAHVVVGNNRN
ncbi:hypothetical protein E2C01_057041 [Portunus trituberculatus]|uniref:Uncharacterized protein n=1 Tax=Portunus trituberculatus TaxID=210409 RepID=A0A5B7GSF0_PORTR|nr:hypothetical protein [Portunus trituberculatus]